MATLLPTQKSDPELYPYRSGLVFGFFNALVWQIAIGTPMVLFAEQLGASSFQVGLAYSFVFLQTPLQIFATALLPRYGFKKLAMRGWAARSVFLLVPLALAIIAPESGNLWMINTFIASVFFFCIFRTIGASALTAWIFGFLPEKVRGRYFGSDQVLAGIAGVGTLVSCAALFAFLPIYTALLVQYGITIFGSVLSYLSMAKLPDIERPTSISLWSVLRDTPRHLFKPSPFRRFMWLSAWFMITTTSIPPFAAYYLKTAAHQSAGQIMLYEVMRYLGVIAGACLIRRRVDVTGAKPFFLLGLMLYVGVGVLWLLFLLNMLGSGTVLFGIYLLLGLSAVTWNIANLNYLPQVIVGEDRALVVSIYGAVTAFLGGCSPILLGLVLRGQTPTGEPTMNTDAFQWFFVALIVSLSVLSVFMARLKEDRSIEVKPLVIGNALLRPFRAASYLVNLVDLQSVGKKRGQPSKPTED